MIKKIDINQLNRGMFIHDLNCGWMVHPFLRKQFLLDSDEDLATIRGLGVRELFIDTARGDDVPSARPARKEAEAVQAAMVQVANTQNAPRPRTTVAEEKDRAKKIHERTSQVVRGLMQDVRLGKAIEISNVEAVVEDITASVTRNSGALVSLLRLKDADDYTFLHCVSVGTLMITFAHALGLDAETTRQAGIGGLLHDVGKMKIADSILNKPGRLTPEEFELIKRHPVDGHAVLVETGTVGPHPLDITLHHHERVDGSGYPDALPGDRISLLAKMAAIVDVYDAITSDRCYHKGIAPTAALGKMFEWAKFHLDESLVHQFMRAIGIYPVGTLVRLESGRLGVVVEQSEGNPLQPKVKTCFSTRSNTYVVPEIIDLARAARQGTDKIVGHELPEKWGIDTLAFV